MYLSTESDLSPSRNWSSWAFTLTTVHASSFIIHLFMFVTPLPLSILTCADKMATSMKASKSLLICAVKA